MSVSNGLAQSLSFDYCATSRRARPGASCDGLYFKHFLQALWALHFRNLTNGVEKMLSSKTVYNAMLQKDRGKKGLHLMFLKAFKERSQSEDGGMCQHGPGC